MWDEKIMSSVVFYFLGLTINMSLISLSLINHYYYVFIFLDLELTINKSLFFLSRINHECVFDLFLSD